LSQVSNSHDQKSPPKCNADLRFSQVHAGATLFKRAWKSSSLETAGTYVGLTILYLRTHLAIGMSEVSQFSLQFMVLFVMGFVSLMISVLLHFKYRELRKLSENPRVSVFDKTFNVLNLFPEHRQALQNGLIMVFILSVLAYFVIGYVVVSVFDVLLRLALVLPCLGFMMIESVYDIYDNTKDFTKALKDGVKLGKGDYTALFFLKETLPRLRAYYALLAIFLFASFAAAPYVFEPALMIFVQAVSLMWTVPISATGVLGLFIGCFATAAAAVLILKLGGKIKSRIFSFPSSVPFTVWEEQFERGARTLSLWECPPFELSHRPIVEDYEVEEGKRKVLSEKS